MWPTLRRTAELGGNVRSGLEDTFYLPDGSRAKSSGELIDALVRVCREVRARAAARHPPPPSTTSPRQPGPEAPVGRPFARQAGREPTTPEETIAVMGVKK